MYDALHDRLAAGGRIAIPEAAWLWEHGTDHQLRELAGLVRSRYHRKDHASYLIMAIVNTTNICVARCDYCAFYRLPKHPEGYLLTFEQIAERIDALVAHGGALIGFNGGFHPKLRIADYAELFGKVRARYPDLAFYELTVAEFMYSCKVSRLTYAEGARILRASGTRWVTGGGAEVLDDGFRMRHSPLKYTVEDYYTAQQAILDAGLGSTATMVIGFDETLQERLSHLDRLRRFQDETGRRLPSFLCWTYKPWNTELGGAEVGIGEYLRWLALSRIVLDNIPHVRTSVLTRNADALKGLDYGADDFDLPTEDEVTQSAGATISLDFEGILDAARALGFEPRKRDPWPVPHAGVASAAPAPVDGAHPTS